MGGELYGAPRPVPWHGYRVVPIAIANGMTCMTWNSQQSISARPSLPHRAPAPRA